LASMLPARWPVSRCRSKSGCNARSSPDGTELAI
jgi:hypothetical protein